MRLGLEGVGLQDWGLMFQVLGVVEGIDTTGFRYAYGSYRFHREEVRFCAQDMRP